MINLKLQVFQNPFAKLKPILIKYHIVSFGLSSWIENMSKF